MRMKAETILEFGESDEHQIGIVRDYRDEYKRLSEILDKQPQKLPPSPRASYFESASAIVQR